ncbi:MAG: LysR family transcriptional regulator [Selenomonadaceae bacterium]|nr:LysR family transcriptional regulator [Selenomonadaceae bacterium]
MDVRVLKYFLTVAREENFTRAAQILYVTQPALSKQLKFLEEELDTKLFLRKNSGIKLTDAGKLLCKRAAELVNLSDKIFEEFTAKKITGGEIYFGLAESYQIRFLAREIKNLKNFYPDLHYHITSGDTEQVIDKLDSGLLDFAVLAENPDFQKYNFLEFPQADEWGLILPADDELARLEKISFENLIGLPLFCSGQGWKKDIAKWCNGQIEKLFLEGSFRLSYNGSIFVKEKLGYLLSLNHLIDVSEKSGLVFRPLDPKLETKIYLVWKKYPTFSRMAEIFLDRIKNSFEVNTLSQ